MNLYYDQDVQHNDNTLHHSDDFSRLASQHVSFLAYQSQIAYQFLSKLATFSNPPNRLETLWSRGVAAIIVEAEAVQQAIYIRVGVLFISSISTLFFVVDKVGNMMYIKGIEAIALGTQRKTMKRQRKDNGNQRK